MGNNDPALPTEVTMRTAVGNRDPAYDGRFVYGVITTGVYCKPSCRSRAAKPENLRFFLNIGLATAAGLRPCKRCRPNEISRSQQLAAVARYIEQNADSTLTLRELAQRAGLSSTNLQREFKRLFGVSPKCYQDEIRLKRVKHDLKKGESITAATYRAGYGSSSRFYETAAKSIGMRPKSYRNGGAGERISYACCKTALGTLMIAATDVGVCFVQFGANEKELVTALNSEFPAAAIVESAARRSEQLQQWLRQLNEYINGLQAMPELPLDIRGTAFQILVWRYLIDSPTGTVMSYSELADGIGKPKAARAAASACAKNRIALLIPCHRVLRSNGDLGGYRWGMARKRSLIDVERKRPRKGK
ncbi:MAG: bifunctional DNA-binding transcriptional regulator/O6-methylguanine-DNA methyltransferase Ada [Gammaproteobacteria bacterium]